MSDKNNLIEINEDIIRELRDRGKYAEASMLLNAFRKDVKKSGRDAKNDLLRRDMLIKKSKGICIVPGCDNKPNKNRVKCKSCLDYNKEWDGRWRNKIKKI